MQSMLRIGQVGTLILKQCVAAATFKLRFEQHVCWQLKSERVAGVPKVAFQMDQMSYCIAGTQCAPVIIHCTQVSRCCCAHEVYTGWHLLSRRRRRAATEDWAACSQACEPCMA